MTFLSPNAFWLLGALSIPIIIHILNRLNVKKVDYSSILFIKELRSSSIYRLHLQKLLILILRMLFISSLVLMFAEPVTKGFIPGWFASEQDASLVVIIDNSASMTATRNDKSHLEISKNETMALLPNYKEETQIIISQTCPPKIVFKGNNNHSDIRNSIKYIQPSNDYDNLWESVIKILSYKDITGIIKECVVFSDFMYAPDSSLNVNIDPFLMAVAVGASCAFLTPIGHQCNALILGPGGYKFSDYWKMGLPLEILIVTLGTPLILYFWPL